MTTVYTSVASSSIAQATHNCVRASKCLITIILVLAPLAPARDTSTLPDVLAPPAGARPMASLAGTRPFAGLDAICLTPLNNDIGLPDTNTDQDYEPPDDRELWPGACTETPMWIRGKPETFWVWPQQWYAPLSERIGCNMHNTT